MEGSCRLCLQDSNKLISVFQFREENKIADVILIICSVKIEPDEVYSKEICSNCLDTVYKAYDLRIQSIKNDQYLKEKDASYKYKVKLEHNDDDFIKYEPELISDDGDTRDYSDNPSYEIVEVSIQTPAAPSLSDDTKTFCCDKCPRVLNSKHEMEMHIKNLHFNFNICTICSKHFSSKTVLKQHLLRKHLCEEPLSCEHCPNMTFKSQKKLEKHQEVHAFFSIENGPDWMQTFSCRYCMNQYHDLNDRLFEHIHYHKKAIRSREKAKQAGVKRIREEYESLVCPHCGQIYRTKQILQQHIKRHFDTGDKYACSKCPQKFKSWGELYYHNAVHTTERNFICEICSKAFKAKRDLRNHKIRHETKDVKKFQCTYCHLMLKNKYTLNRHILIHTGEVNEIFSIRFELF